MDAYTHTDAEAGADAGTEELLRALVMLGIRIVFVSPGEMDGMTERMREAIPHCVPTAAPDTPTATSGLASANVATAAARTPLVDPVGIIDAADRPAKAAVHSGRST